MGRVDAVSVVLVLVVDERLLVLDEVVEVETVQEPAGRLVDERVMMVHEGLPVGPLDGAPVGACEGEAVAEAPPEGETVPEGAPVAEPLGMVLIFRSLMKKQVAGGVSSSLTS